MKSINLLSLYEFPMEDIIFYANHLMKREEDNDFSIEEYNDIKQLIALTIDDVKPGIWNDFFISYRLPRISKEFDLLKVTENSVINIELKSKYPKPKDKIQKQLIQNKDYLKRLEKKNSFLFTVVLETKECYILSEKDEINLVPLKTLTNTLNTHFKEPGYEESGFLFKDDEFLISPLINPNEFLDRHYYLTESQKSTKDKILKSLESGNQFISLSGGFGTGKTLLLYDIARTLAEKDCSSVLVIHAASMPKNIEIHEAFGPKFLWPFEVTCIKSKYDNLDTLKDYRYILIDESQRLYKGTFDSIKRIVEKNNLSCIFSLDPSQWISIRERNTNINKEIEQIVSKNDQNELKKKIRCPEDINKFVTTLFNLNIPIKDTKIKNVDILYCNSYESAIKVISSFEQKNYTFINHSSPPFNKPRNSWKDYDGHERDTHEVIGHEFEKVIVVIDENFYFNESQQLKAHTHPYSDYSYLKTLEQALTRATSKLLVIVENNLEVFNRLNTLILENS